MLFGTFEGSGTWHDAAGKSMSYTVAQTNVETERGFDIAFVHEFIDGSTTDARFSMIWIAPSLFRVEAGGAEVGNGYVFNGYCHYHLKAGDTYVEASYRVTDNGLEVYGSSTTNKEGLYIAWKEILRRAERV
jgi:hypothetical protein